MPTDAAPPPLDRSCALFLDFDGTLTNFQLNPATVRLPDHGGETLRRVADRLDGALAIVSGRDARDLADRTPTDLWRAGGHGIEIVAPGASPACAPPDAPTGLEAAIDAAAGPLGARVERKGPVLAIHYRAAPAIGADLERALAAALKNFPEYRLEGGKMVFETKPHDANKGRAVDALMARAPFAGRAPVFVGDDRTDEDGFEACARLGGRSVKVGEGDTTATSRLAGPGDVWTWLKAFAAA
ncbi:MAG: trehalose-phosphatase [Parvularculaceae bacterium]